MRYKKYIIALATILSFDSCVDLNLKNPESITSSDVWEDPSLVQMYVNHLYIKLPGWDHKLWNNISDEARDNYPSSTPEQVLKGEWNEASNPMDNWSDSYKYIRVANDFLVNIQTATVDEKTKQVTSAEVRFIRALFYFDLIKRYGGVPLIVTPQDLNSDLEVPRNSISECYQFIVDEMDEIADHLPIDAERGKITKGAALSLKARTLLYWASPLYNEEKDLSKWQIAADAAKAVMDLGKYDLYPDLKQLWLDMSESHKEVILERQYGMPDVSHGWDCAVKTLDLANGDAGHCSPLQELVDAFPMKNGKLINEEGSGYDPTNPYEGRDDRFYADIAYNQAVISGMQGGKLNKNYVLNIYKGGNDYDNPQGNPAYQIYTTYTGYMTVKAVDPNNEVYGYWYGSVQPWIIFRYAEILLDFAEAQNEATGPTPEVYAALNKLRHRAGITTNLPENMTQAQMRELIRNERYVELCFEHHRYWDLRRWKLAEEKLNNNTYTGVVITKESDGSFSYEYEPVEATPLVFTEKMYFMPIPQSEISKNSQLKQNPGWTD